MKKFVINILSRIGRKLKINSMANLFLFARYVEKNKDRVEPEAQFIQFFFRDHNIKNGVLVDIGAHDGFSMSSTFGLIRMGWSGLCVELDPERFFFLSSTYGNNREIGLARVKATPQNINSLLNSFNISSTFEFLNVDIDSYDLDLTLSLLKNYRPMIISLEINEKIPASIFFNVNYNEDLILDGSHFYGCSLAASVELIEPFGYKLIELVYNNAIFARTEGMELSSLNYVTDKMKSGYLNKKNRKELFYYNIEFEKIYDMDSKSAIKALNNIFKKNKDFYTLRPTNLLH
jgi:hypothetical protein